MGEVGMKREIEEDGDGHHSAKLRGAVTVGKVGKRVDSEEHSIGRTAAELKETLKEGRCRPWPWQGGATEERAGSEGLTRDWPLKDRGATQTGAGEYEGTATSTPRTRSYSINFLFFLSHMARWWRVPPIVALS